MTPRPTAEVHLTLELARQLLREQHPDLAERPLSPVAQGWDNALFRLGQHHLVRLPRHQLAGELVRHEHRWLPHIAHLVHLPVPAPVRHGYPTAYFPWAWSITRWIEGIPAARTPVGSRGRWAGVLARFAVQLHQTAPREAPHSTIRGVPLAARDDVFRQRLQVADHPRGPELLSRWEEALQVPGYAGAPVWVHGDPHPLNMITQRGQLAAVIDFGDLTAGDPASDLATAWQTFDWPGRAMFVVRYAELAGRDENLWRRARGWAVLHAVTSLALSADDPDFTAIAEHTVGQVLDAPDAQVAGLG